MKKVILLLFMMMVLAACGSKEETASQTDNPAQTTEDVETETSPQNEEQSAEEDETDVKEETDNSQEEEQSSESEKPEETNADTSSKSGSDRENFNSVMPSGWDIKLPADFPVTKGKYLTATTSSKENAITYHFYETDKKLAINDSQIKKSGKSVGKLVITKYATKEAASKEIDQTVFKDGEAVDLGHGITGYQDAGAGSLFTSWNEGRWAITARSRTQKSDESLARAKDTVEFLETHMMPIPKQYGQLHVDAEKAGSLAKWQKQNYVYSLTDFRDNTLNWLVTFK